MKVIHASGTRKRAIARATARAGHGSIKINNLDISHWGTELLRMKIIEPTILAKDVFSKMDVSIKVFGGGLNGQAEAARLAIARAMIQHNPKLKELFANYDRHLVVADVRQRETRKPNTAGNARGKTQKSYR